MSVIFAIALTLTQVGDTLVPELSPSFGSAALVTLRVPYAAFIQKAVSSEVSYEHTRIIVPRGTVLDRGNDAHRVAVAFERLRRPATFTRTLAVFVIHLTLFFLASTYLRRFGAT